MDIIGGSPNGSRILNIMEHDALDRGNNNNKKKNRMQVANSNWLRLKALFGLFP